MAFIAFILLFCVLYYVGWKIVWRLFRWLWLDDFAKSLDEYINSKRSVNIRINKNFEHVETYNDNAKKS